jgi:hypothetical protein
VEVVALLDRRTAPVDVAAVDLGQVADRDVGAGKGQRLVGAMSWVLSESLQPSLPKGRKPTAA